jgi:hypothetical protein
MGIPSDRVRARALRYGIFEHAASVDIDDLRALDLFQRERGSPAYKESARRALALSNAFLANAPSLYIDHYLRYFMAEYNNRTFKSYGAQQPLSFNVMAAFMEPDERAFMFILLEERFHSFALSQYLDFATDPSYALDWKYLSTINELEIYEFNQLGAPASVELPGMGAILFAGVAIVRAGTEIAVCAVFGEQIAGSEIPELPEEKGAYPPGKEFLAEIALPSDPRPEEFFSVDGYSPLLVMMQLNCRDQSRNELYVLREMKHGFQVIHDDAEIYDEINELKPEYLEGIRSTNLAALRRYNDLIELSTQLIGLPHYFEASEDDIQIERHPTRYRTEKVPPRVQKQLASLERRFHAQYREVRTLSTQPLNREVTQKLRRSGLRMETTGYWKRLEFGKVGSDKHGGLVHGKTWVTKDVHWHETPLIEQESLVEVEVSDVAGREDPAGFVYAMRSPAHPPNVFKVGWTARAPDARADDLSGTTGQPDRFLVVEQWRVAQPRAVEAKIHAALAAYRLSNSREFFRLKYDRLHAEIRRVVGPFLLEEA